MQIIKSIDIQRKFGQHLETSFSEPILIEKNGMPIAAMISIEYFEQLQALEDKYWAEKAIEAQKTGYTSHDKAIESLTLR